MFDILKKAKEELVVNNDFLKRTVEKMDGIVESKQVKPSLQFKIKTDLPWEKTFINPKAEWVGSDKIQFTLNFANPLSLS